MISVKFAGIVLRRSSGKVIVVRPRPRLRRVLFGKSIVEGDCL
jgi:hypothetical protein